MPWIVRRSAYLLNRYAIHSNGNTSHFNRRGRESHTPICEFRETVQHMVSTTRQLPKLEPRNRSAQGLQQLGNGPRGCESGTVAWLSVASSPAPTPGAPAPVERKTTLRKVIAPDVIAQSHHDNHCIRDITQESLSGHHESHLRCSHCFARRRYMPSLTCLANSCEGGSDRSQNSKNKVSCCVLLVTASGKKNARE